MIRQNVLAIISILVSSGTMATHYGDVLIDEVHSISDVKTFNASIHSWPKLAGHRIPITIKGLEVPNAKGRCKAETLAAHQGNKATTTILQEAKSIQLKQMERGTSFQILADVYVDGVHLGDKLIQNGHALAKAKSKKHSWCKKGLQDFSRGYKRFK